MGEAKRGMEHSDHTIDPYRLMIYAHQNYRYVWRQAWFMNKLFRIQNRVRRGV